MDRRHEPFRRAPSGEDSWRDFLLRVVINGTLPDIGCADAMPGYLSNHKIRLFDYAPWAEPLQDELRNHAEQPAVDAGIEIEFIRRQKAFRKKAWIKAIIAGRGDHPQRPGDGGCNPL